MFYIQVGYMNNLKFDSQEFRNREFKVKSFRRWGLGLKLGIRRQRFGLLVGGFFFPRKKHDYMLFIAKAAIMIRMFFFFFLSTLCFCQCLMLNVLLLFNDYHVVICVLHSSCFCYFLVMCCLCVVFIVLVLLHEVYHVLIAFWRSWCCWQLMLIVFLLVPCIHLCYFGALHSSCI